MDNLHEFNCRLSACLSDFQFGCDVVKSEWFEDLSLDIWFRTSCDCFDPFLVGTIRGFGRHVESEWTRDGGEESHTRWEKVRVVDCCLEVRDK